MTNNNRINNGRHIRRSSDRARAITKAKAKKQNIIISTTAIALAAVTAVCFLIFGGAFSPKTANAPILPATSVSAAKDAGKAAQNPNQANTQIATQAPQDDDQTSAQVVSYDTDNNSNQSYTPAQTSDDNNNNNAQDQSDDNIQIVNGERVYIDTKRPAPDKSGTPAHFYANGKTSYGFDWNYDADNSNFVIRCDYNFDEQQYDFQFYGTAPGTAHITVYYNTDNNTQATADLTLVVDDNLNANIA